MGDAPNSDMPEGTDSTVPGESPAAPLSDVGAAVAPPSPEDSPAKESQGQGHSVRLLWLGLGIAGGLGAARLIAKRKQA